MPVVARLEVFGKLYQEAHAILDVVQVDELARRVHVPQRDADESGRDAGPRGLDGPCVGAGRAGFASRSPSTRSTWPAWTQAWPRPAWPQRLCCGSSASAFPAASGRLTGQPDPGRQDGPRPGGERPGGAGGQGLRAGSRAQFLAGNSAVVTQQYNIFWRVSLFSPTAGFLTRINTAVLLGYGGWLVAQGRLPLGAGLVVFAGLLDQFAARSNVATIVNSIQQSLIGARRVFEILDAPIDVRTPPTRCAGLASRGRSASRTFPSSMAASTRWCGTST